MTMLINVPHHSAPTVRTGLRVLSAQFCNLVNYWVAAALARRERQATLVVRRYLRNRDVREIGVYRYKIGDAPAHTAESNRNASNRPG
jgi:hypothetical protein